MIILYSVLIFLFLLFIILFSVYFIPEKIQSGKLLNKISIVVAAKNESNNIGNLIEALSNQSYPENYFEVILIDDNSSDDTYELAKKLSTGYPNFRVIRANNEKYMGKRGALQTGIENSTNPYILITDADCIPSKNWIEKLNVKFNEGFDFVFGLAPFSPENNFTNKLARFENLWTHILTFSFARMGFPYSAAARNLGFKKIAFEKIGGYANTTDTLSGDDDLLLREAVKNKFKIGCVTDNEAAVYSSTPKNFKQYLHQKARHTSTSHHYLFIHKLLLLLWHVINIVLLFGIFFINFNPLFLYGFLIKLSADYILTYNKMRILNYKFSLFELLYLQVIYDLLIMVNFINSFFHGQNWKSE